MLLRVAKPATAAERNAGPAFLCDGDRPDVAAARFDLAGLLDRPVMYFGSLNDDDATHARILLRRAASAGQPVRDVGSVQLAVNDAVQAMQFARHGGDLSAVPELIAELTSLYATLPGDHEARHAVASVLGAAHRDHGHSRGDQNHLQEAARYLRKALPVRSTDPENAAFHPANHTLGLLSLARVDPDRDILDQAIVQARWCLTRGPILKHPDLHHLLEGTLRCHLGLELLHAGLRDDDHTLFELGVTELERLRQLAAEGWGSTTEYAALSRLTFAYALRSRRGGETAGADLDLALETGHEAMRELATYVLLQHGAEHALTAARAGTTLALRVAGWAAERGRATAAVEALEQGRALVLHTAAASSRIPELLQERGHRERAEQWRTAAPEDFPRSEAGQAFTRWSELSGEAQPPGPSELRFASFEALGTFERFDSHGGRGTRNLFGHTAPAKLITRLADCGADALVYLIPGTTAGSEGHALLLRPGHETPAIIGLPHLGLADPTLTRYLDTAAARSQPTGPGEEAVAEARWRQALEKLCDWAWPAAIAPVLTSLEPLGRPPRVVLVPCDRLGMVPWHAARGTPRGRESGHRPLRLPGRHLQLRALRAGADEGSEPGTAPTGRAAGATRRPRAHSPMVLNRGGGATRPLPERHAARRTPRHRTRYLRHPRGPTRRPSRRPRPRLPDPPLLPRPRQPQPNPLRPTAGQRKTDRRTPPGPPTHGHDTHRRPWSSWAPARQT
ncbi:hypothetical protein RM844_14705 [Streptomyces sp. DSM 44915]|uniref:CHAT domain-containing protein n=1 Tax=Streptomyces chisholmiae TaxID=3075540 RepID=A0ABU2JS45_9ACTN|nr:hypothetical protein [Streptomyces sp. DSM 44915]MDT0267538.1 hypothetical protein [Streptomyces sp. DSM 44915]